MALNNEQKLIVNEHKKNILLLASAGTGKTDTLSKRVATIISENKAIPAEILCITFTNKACREMSDRVQNIVGHSAKEITIKTFHSFCFDIIKSNAKKRTDIFSDFIIYDEEDCKELIKTCNYYDFPLKALQAFIKEIKMSRAKIAFNKSAYEIPYEDIAKKFIEENDEQLTEMCTEKGNLNKELKEFLKTKGITLVKTYNSLLYSNHGLDFDDLILKVKELFEDKDLIKGLSDRYKFINIDEVQDVSTLEYFIIEKLFKNNNVLMCGDIFQTIYTWRGSAPDIILNHFKDKYNAIEIVFNKNYRGTKYLTEASLDYLKNAFPEKVSGLYKDGLKAESSNNGEKISLSINNTARDEARYIFDSIKNLKEDVKNLKIAVLTRDNSYNISLSKYLNSMKYEGADFEFILVDQFKFFRRQEIKDIIAFLKLIANRHDSLSLKRIINRLPTGIGEKTLDIIESDLYKKLGINVSDFIDENVIDYGEKFSLLINEFENDNVIIFDVESTGVDVTEDEIIQIAAIKLNNEGKVIDKFEKFIKNNVSVATSQHIHGFSDDFLRDRGEDKKSVLIDFLNFSKDTVVVGHNVQFDINILSSELSRLNLGSYKFKAFYDTLDIYRRFYPNCKNHKLDTLSGVFETTHKPTHDAMDDILATGELLVRAINTDIKPTSMERISLMSKYIKQFSSITSKLNNLFNKSEDLRPQDIVVEIINSFNIKTLYTGADGEEKIERLRDFYFLLRELDNRDKCSGDALLEVVKITSLSNGELESLIINRTKIPRIPIITIHQAKGLEYDIVFIAGAQDNTFPSFRALRSRNLEEEKRLFYVAITRAKKKLYITCNTAGYFGHNNPSSLLNYISKKYIIV